MSKEVLYSSIKAELVTRGCSVNPYRAIQHGVQFLVFLGTDSGLVRIYEGKKGVRVDLSQLVTVSELDEIVRDVMGIVKAKLMPVSTERVEMDRPPSHTGDPDELVGVDESGKGDYFGPLVIAGVFANPDIAAKLKALGVKDSKQLSEDQIFELEPQIREICPFTVVILNNLVYNDVYEKFPNLNNILAWGHGRVIDNMVKQINCKYVLCDQFGHQSLIQNALLLRGVDVVLFQRHRAEDNVAVAAASILARSGFLQAMKQMREKYKIRFPKGCPPEAYAIRSQFIERYGEDRLVEVAKLHFKLSE